MRNVYGQVIRDFLNVCSVRSSSLRSFIRFVIVVTLVVSGAKHLMQPYFFMNTVASYELLPESTIFLFSFLLPGFQVALGVALLLRLTETTGAACSVALFAAFAIAQSTVLARGMDIDCGCYGFNSTQVSHWSVVIPSAFALGSVFLLWKSSPKAATSFVKSV